MNFKGNESASKLRGGYYTPAGIAQFLTEWALAHSPREVLEPGCGDGAFLRAISDRKGPIERILAFETDASEAEKAALLRSQLKPTRLDVHKADFLAWAAHAISENRQFDAAVGNPPFIRYQYLDQPIQGAAEKVFSLTGLRYTKHTNAWVSFVIAAVRLLRAGGRLAMLVPAEILHVLHAQSLRSYLLSTCRRILLIDSEELWFSDALQGAVLLCAEKAAPTQSREGIKIVSLRRKDLEWTSVENIFEANGFIDPEMTSGKWMPALLSPSEFALLKQLEHHDGVGRFGDSATASVGIVTGANRFFLVPDETVREFDLDEWARPMFGRSEHVDGLIYDNRQHETNRMRGLPTNFIQFDDRPMARLPRKARTYIELGEEEGLHRRFKCRIRSPWYVVPSVYSTKIAMLKRSHDFPRLVLNKTEAFTTDTAYRIRTRGSTAAFVAGFINSLTALSCELEGRHYGGGVLELVPSEIARILIPRRGTGTSLGDFDRFFRSESDPQAVLEQGDELNLMPLGLKRSDASALRSAWMKLRSRRQRTTLNEEIFDTPSPIGGPKGNIVTRHALAKPPLL